MSILSLPVEITLEILRYVQPEHSPLVGNDVAWTKSEKIHNWWRRPRDLSLDPASLGLNPYGDIEDTPYSTLLALQRYFNAICTPFLYTEINALDGLDYAPIMKYKDHIKTLRIKIGPTDILSNKKLSFYLDFQQISSILSACSNATSLIVYYMPSGLAHIGFYENLATRIKEFVVKNKIQSLGICLTSTVDDYQTWDNKTGPTWLLQALIAADTMWADVGMLDIACTAPLGLSYPSMQHMVSLTVREAITIHSTGSLLQFSSTTLVKLQLIECQGVHAGHLPVLVDQCPALRYLFVSTCGDASDVELPFRPAGWSEESDALWRRHDPLVLFHLEHMLGWEIAAMGTIPAKEVVITSLRERELLYAFEKDKEMFPRMTTLRSDADVNMSDEEKIILARTLVKRDVVWMIDAHWTVNQTYP
ncbi:hypothetical protein FRC17_009513 [Serendipita sp. 399]|nr:hypothetical protein FRC17_009513 [Serendipita sp. 399]